MASSKLPFDFGKARGPKRGPDVGKDVTDDLVAGQGGPKAISVTSLLALIKGALSDTLPPRLTVVGEISNLKLHSSGHIYFSLKDAGACISSAMFRQAAARLRFKPADGMEVVVEGRVDVYEVRGQLQMYVDSMTPKGAGALELAFRQLQEKLQKEGLFDPAHKLPLPRYPRCVGVITSATGAAVRDIRRTLVRRWPGAVMYLMPVLVQGAEAAEDIASAIAMMDANAARYGIDTIILARGGGSMEDLWAFNEEVVARAIFACRTPLVCGVGHEVDVTIADLVADVRAPTPTGAAELAVPDQADVRRGIAILLGRLTRSTGDMARSARGQLESCLRSVVFRNPRHRLNTAMQRLDELSHRLRGGAVQRLAGSRRRLEPLANRLAALHPARLRERAMRRLADLTARLRWVLGGQSKRNGDALSALQSRLLANHPRHRVQLARQRAESLSRHLEAMSYRSVLKRGYSVTRGPGGAILRAPGEVSAGQAIQTELAAGRIDSIVQGTRGTGPNEQEQTAQAPIQKETPARRPKPAKKTDDDFPLLFD